LAHLVEGYALLMTQGQFALWTQKGTHTQLWFEACTLSDPTATSVNKSNTLPKQHSSNTINGPTMQRSLFSPVLPSHTGKGGTSTSDSEQVEQGAGAEVIDDDEVDYATPLSMRLCFSYVKPTASDRDYHVDRSRVQLEELLGQGQFGDVYKGSFKTRVWTELRTGQY
jgi:hypothetical protein